MDRSSLRTLALSAIALFIMPRLICADDPPAVMKAKGILRGLLDERDKLVRGVCRVKGKKVAHGGTNPDVDGETKGLIAFDFSKGLFRYDNDEPAYRGRIGPGDFKKSGKETFDEFLKTVPQNLVTLKLRYIRNTEYVAVWFSTSKKDTNNIHLYDPEHGAIGEGLSSDHHPFDIRACGMLDYSQFRSGGWPAGTRVADYCEFIKRHKITDIGKTALGKEIVFEDTNWKRELTVDTANGFCPVDYVSVSRNDPPIVSNGHAEWRRVKDVDVWVPKSMFIRQIDPDGSVIKYDLEFTWENVNKPVNASYFDHKSFPDIPEDVRVTDTRPDEQ